MTSPHNSSVTSPSVTSPAAIRDRHARLTACVLGLGAFLTQFDVTALVVVMPEIGRDLGLGMPGLAWVVDAYSLAFTAALLAAGALADRHGRRRVLLLGNALFAAASVACALAGTAPALCIARAAQGIGAAFLITGAIASIAGAFPDPALRARALALTGILSGVAMALGPTLGGLLAAWLGWPAIFLANILPCGLIALAIPRFVQEARREVRHPVDWPGLLVLTAALGLAVEGVLQAHATPMAGLSGMAASLALAAAFARRQRRREHPLIDPALASDRSVCAVVVLLLTVSAGYWAVLVSLPAFLMAAYGMGAQEAGVALLAATLPMLVLPPVGSRMVRRFGWRHTFGSALALIAFGNAVLAGAAGASAKPGALVGMAAIGAGAALAHSQLTGAIVTLAPRGAAGMASAVTMVARQGGFALGVAALGVLAPSTPGGTGYAVVFAAAAIAGLVGLGACTALPDRPR
ncbi:MFS transporter [Methylobacterium sp. SyP6R]|uniref:MFS transporter n=1 Tax=Methylobacterium sp. SyP6R TaxID=2718876 RepID=UPI001F19B308|nr:MFS transporter [Methylobacterium sp. SyP6R]MCF4125253.1 MFS transporter [Methylobacterium sp. SyP6R]